MSDLHGVREVARRDKRTRFTALLHHVTAERQRDSYYALKRDAAPGVDGVTWREYETDLDAKLAELHCRIHRGTYRAQPSKRAYIPKADGRERPLGIAALEDKIVQHAVTTVLNQIYEEDFLGSSYGFRPGRSQHHALDALWVAIMRKKVNWVLDADIRALFDNLSHEWMGKFIEHRVADRRILGLIRKWLRAGVSEQGEWSKTEVGVPQGSVVSPLLSNISAAFQHLAALRFRPVGEALAQASRRGRDGHRPLRGWLCATTARKGGPDGHLKQPCCTRDEGRPLEAGGQAQASNHRKLQRSRAVVVSVAVKGGTRFRQVWCRETSASEPPRKCRKRMDDVETGRMSLAREESGGWPDCCPDGIRHEGGVTLHLALARNVGTCRPDAERFLEEWKDRLRKFGLELHPDKTRLIEFGRHAAEDRKRRGEGKPEAFNFLGFTHMCGKTRKTGRFIVKRKTIPKRLSARLRELKRELRRRWHQPVVEVGAWLRLVVQGYFNYHAVPGNMDSLNSFRAQVIWRWYRALRRRSQRDRMTWERFWPLVDRWIPSAKILHPHPNLRFDASHPR